MTAFIGRREFITLLGGAAAAWPLVALAQQPERMRRIDVLLPAAADDSEFQARLAAFLQGLQRSGWNMGSNMRIDIRWAEAMRTDFRSNAAELVDLAPDVILATRSSQCAQFASRRPAPCRSCSPGQSIRSAPALSTSLARPGGNITGFTPFEYSLSGEMAGTAQGDFPGSDARGGSSRYRHWHRYGSLPSSKPWRRSIESN